MDQKIRLLNNAIQGPSNTTGVIPDITHNLAAAKIFFCVRSHPLQNRNLNHALRSISYYFEKNNVDCYKWMWERYQSVI